MTSLAEFLRPIRVAGKPLGDGFLAYRMDGGERDEECPDMRKFAGLGESDCCDYFLPAGDAVVLMEESQLFRQMREDIGGRFAYLGAEDLRDFSVQEFKRANRLKVYASMLALCRLASSEKAAELRDEVREKTRAGLYDFWLVVGDEVGAEDERALQSMTDELRIELRGLLSREGVRNVKVLRASELERELSRG